MMSGAAGMTKGRVATFFRAPSWRRDSLKSRTAYLAFFLAILSALAANVVCAQTASEMLARAREESDASKKIEILSEALKTPGLRGDLLSSLLFERGLAYKKLKDCFRATEDFSSALAHSRKALPARLESAECLIEVDQLEEATREVEYYLLSRTTDARPYVIKGKIYEREGFLTKAQDEYTRALHYDPQCKAARAARANVLLRTGSLREALSDAHALVELDPKASDVFEMRARIHVKLKDYEAALRDYKTAESLRPGDDDLITKRIKVYFEMGDPERALEALNKRGGASESPDIEGFRAKAYLLSGNYDEAEKILRQILTKSPGSAPAHVYMGMTLTHRRKLDEALEYLNRAIELDGTLVEAYKERARIFSELGDSVRAASDLTKGLSMDPADGELFALRGLTLMKRRLFNAAIKDFSRALENRPDDSAVLYERAVAYLLMDEPEPALADLNRVLEITPGAARAISLRGVAYFKLGRTAEARADLRKAPNVEPRDAMIWNNLGFFHYKTGDLKAAMDAINKALQLDPNYGKARYNLKLVLDRDTAKKTASPDSMPVSRREDE